MTLAEPRTAVDLPSRGPVKMDDRKRPATCDTDDAAHPPKRQATATNGGKVLHRDDGMPFKEDLEQYQKEAIWRQMQEYKREKNTLEDRLSEMKKRSVFHDDHLRIIDAWWKQLLDEVKLLAGDIENLGSEYQNGNRSSFPSELLFANNEKFENHLESRSKDIKSTISRLFENFSKFTPDVKDLQARISKLLASEKAHVTELDRVRAEKEQLEERLENASLRYMVAEKKLDRAKSQSVAKLERQAIFAGGNEAGGEGSNKVKVEASDAVNGVAGHGDVNADADAGQKETIAVTVKQKEQLEKLESENEKLTGMITTMNARLSRLSDDEVARSDIFKHLKSQHEGVITRINHLEATNVQLREEAEKLQAERTAYRTQIDTESQTAIGEMESQLARAETDLARIRTARDELAADVSIRRASQDQEQIASDQIKELAAVGENRIAVLESEIERLRIQLGQSDSADSRVDLDMLGIDELKRKYESLEKEYSMLTQELPSMGVAYKKAQALATKKVMDFSALEEKVARLLADKSKADQKYFAAMKAKDARENEIRALKLQNSKSSEIVAQLKDAERAHVSLIANLEKQLTETKAFYTSLSTANRSLQQRTKEDGVTIEGFKSQVSELTTSLKAKDATLSSVSKACRSTEIEIEKLRTRLEETKKNVDVWKGRSMGKENGEYEMLRALALCNHDNITVGKTTSLQGAAMGRNKRRKLQKIQGSKTGSTSKAPARPIPQQKKNQRSLQDVKTALPFEPEDDILLVGEGDFSFSRSLAEHHGFCALTATSFDAEDSLFLKYPQARQNVEYLVEETQQRVLYGVDATRLAACRALGRAAAFDRVVFNFPHVGGKSKDVNRQVRYNQGGLSEERRVYVGDGLILDAIELLVGFFKAAIPLLKKPEGAIVLTVFEGEPYTLWNIKDLARHVGLRVGRSFKFQSEMYPGYKHARTLGNIEGGRGWKGETRSARTYIFEINDGQGAQQVNSSKRKRTGGESDSEGED
ncbi:hypothetical protein FGG08_005445 [Glutinoglossum americanum]|uniref:E3 ubiquitin protein ligase n=1 Tax=Glutinoglossum americanum TaxID=1670608 RepID=A0A9P8I099_9PEZI|nr:hypothetical protein FGG08_005445 [Glutinoglossum americanum]